MSFASLFFSCVTFWIVKRLYKWVGLLILPWLLKDFELPIFILIKFVIIYLIQRCETKQLNWIYGDLYELVSTAFVDGFYFMYLVTKYKTCSFIFSIIFNWIALLKHRFWPFLWKLLYAGSPLEACHWQYVFLINDRRSFYFR